MEQRDRESDQWLQQRQPKGEAEDGEVWSSLGLGNEVQESHVGKQGKGEELRSDALGVNDDAEILLLEGHEGKACSLKLNSLLFYLIISCFCLMHATLGPFNFSTCYPNGLAHLLTALLGYPSFEKGYNYLECWLIRLHAANLKYYNY